MSANVIDTNVLIVANEKAGNEKAGQASLTCVSCCIQALDEARQGLVVIDDAFHIFKEYMKEVNLSGEPGVGDAFLSWLWHNQGNTASCEMVTLNADDRNRFVEFPDDPNLADFDPSDHKFVAAAIASRHDPEILNAVDSDWWIHGRLLERNGLKIVHLCEEQVDLWKTTKTRK